jgi:hypothetical protein
MKLVIIHNQETGEIIEREMNADEIAQAEIDEKTMAARDAAQVAKEVAKQAVLAKLGLTADEVAALLG